MFEDRELLRGERQGAQAEDACHLQVNEDLLHQISELSALLASPAESVALSPEINSALKRVRGMIALYPHRAAGDFGESIAGFPDIDLS
jgi:hypothetical protein